MRRRTALVALVTPLLLLGCNESTPSNEPSDPHSASPTAFSGTLTCPAGEEVRAATWDYGPNPRGQTTDAVAWVREHAEGLDERLDLTFLMTAGGLENVVVARQEDGTPLAFVAFGMDAEGRYFPNVSESCPSSGIDDFT